MIGRNTAGLSEHLRRKTESTIKKVDLAIRELTLDGQSVNFNSISSKSGVSKTFIYNNAEIRKRIEMLRDSEVDRKMNRKPKHEKTSDSKDVIIRAKDKKIAELQSENAKLKVEIVALRSKLYELM